MARRVTDRVKSVVVAVAAGLLVTISLSAGGCASAGVAIREGVFNIPKREQLVDRVKEARDSQTEAKQQFESALQEFLAVTGQTGKQGELEARYNKLKSAYDKSESRAKAVTDRINSVEVVAKKLFSEWQAELAQYSNANLRSSSERQLNDTKIRYDQLMGAMRAAESKMPPVLSALKDQVLFLKHNLNAQAIASLQGTVVEVQNDVSQLIRDMQASIDEANRFIEQMPKN